MGRTIIIGDVHGCSSELDRLCERLAVSEADDIYFVGDLLARGPDSLGVLDRVEQLGARCVLGNHELRLLRARQTHVTTGRRPRLSEAHYSVYCQLQPRQWQQLSALPLWLSLPSHGLIVVHAGVLPHTPLEAHGSEVLCFIRTVDERGAASDRNAGRLWAELYEGPRHIVFGHNSRAGLQLHSHATGLDTGCVYGGRLSALVLEEGQRVPMGPGRSDVIVSVAARRSYYSGRPPNHGRR